MRRTWKVLSGTTSDIAHWGGAFLAAALLATASCGDDSVSSLGGNGGSGGGGGAGGSSTSSSGTSGRDASPDDARVDPRSDAPTSAPEPPDGNTAAGGAGGNVNGTDDARVDPPRTDAGRVDPDSSVGRGDVDASSRPDVAGPGASDGGSTIDSARPGWRLVWSDEFDGARGTLPDATKWTPLVDAMPANDELEYYTARTQNVAHDGAGNLVLTALRESYMGSAYTSARIDSAGKFEQAYGRFESRLKLPQAQGIWPAFWIMGNNAQVGWPARGEIDIMEHRGSEPEINVGAMHGPGYSGSLDLRATYTMPGGYASDFHVFAVEWEPNVVRFYVDDHLYQTRTPADLVARGGNLVWVYDHPFYIIYNVAVGGRFPGNPTAATTFPQTLTIDYVRVYAR